MKVTSANFAGNGGSAADGEGEAPGVGVADAAPASAAPVGLSSFLQADVKRTAEMAISKANRKIIFYCSLFFLKKSSRAASSQVNTSLRPVIFSRFSSTSGGSAYTHPIVGG